METITSLGMSAGQWQFLSQPNRYAEASGRAGRPLVPASTVRQFVTARDILIRLNGSYAQPERRGVLLADDVGLGKTTVAALVAWVVACAGAKRRVRILAPNDVMVRRWAEELLSHVSPLGECARFLDARESRVKVGRLRSLKLGSIQVVKHHYASSDSHLGCDLLVVDEAHRAKGKDTEFSKSLRRQKKYAARVLILTATPFSIQIEELERMLHLVGADPACAPVRKFSRALHELYHGSTARCPQTVASRLAERAEAAVDAMRPHVVRHGIDDLPAESSAFGGRADWTVEVPAASESELELVLRMDRALRVVGRYCRGRKATNDARFHVGWQHLRAEQGRVEEALPEVGQPDREAVAAHLGAAAEILDNIGVHSKMAAVGRAVKEAVGRGEKVLLFCHHHATAEELTAHLGSVLPVAGPTGAPDSSNWRSAWDEALGGDHAEEAVLRTAFIEWLCCDAIRAQVWGWLRPTSTGGLADLLGRTPARHPRNPETLAAGARRLLRAVLQSRSSRAVLAAAAEGRGGLPGNTRVLGVCRVEGDDEESDLFAHNSQPDAVIAVFNSPLGPDVLVVTDRLSEGIDLHRYCRHLVHYELDPSPVRTVQRNGRLRRVNSWAAVTGEPIRYAYPAFRGTRDHRLVEIMKKRIGSFTLLLGGVEDFTLDQVRRAEERWRDEVIALARDRLAKLRGRLNVGTPEPTE